MHPSDPFARALSRRSTLPSELMGLDSDPLWAALLTSVQNVVLGEVRSARYPELADESRREMWPELLDRLGHDSRVRIGREIVDQLTVGTVDDLWVSWMRMAGTVSNAGTAGMAGVDPDAMGGQAVTSGDPVVQERIVDLLELLGEVVDVQLADRFGVPPDESRPEAVEFSLSDAGPAPEPVSVRAPEPAAEHVPEPAALIDAGLVVSLPPALAQPAAQPAAVPTFDWAPGPSHPIAAAAEPKPYPVPPAAPGWRPLPTMPAGRTPATFGRRAAAFLIDRAITILITTAAGLLFIWPAASYTSSTPRPAAGGLVIALAFVGVGVVSIGWFLVVAWLTGTRGASPGKRIMRIEVVGFSSPGPIGFGRALLRELILAAFAIGSLVTAWLPYASVFWDSTKQLRGWHDKAVDDIVVDTASL